MGTYNILIKDGAGCTLEKSAVITQGENNLAFEAEGKAGSEEGTGFIEVDLVQGRAPYTLDLTGSTRYLTIVEDDHVIENLPSGDYLLLVVDGNGCLQQSAVEIPKIANRVEPVIFKTENAVEPIEDLSVQTITPSFTTNLDNSIKPTELSIKLFSNFPNPFHEQTTIPFQLPQEMDLTIKIIDQSGRVVKMIQQPFSKGYNQLILFGSDLEKGMYHLSLEAIINGKPFNFTQKISRF